MPRVKKDSTFILWNPLSNLPPKVVFKTEEEALRCAKGMAERCKTKFLVMRAVAAAEPRKPPIKVTKF